MKKNVFVVIAVITAVLLGASTASAQPTNVSASASASSSSDDFVIGEPLEDTVDTYRPAVQLEKVCTFVTSPSGAKLKGVGLTGRFNNRFSDYPGGYEMKSVDDWGQPLAGASAFVKAGKRSGSFVILPKGEPSDNLLHMVVRALDTEFTYMDFSPSSLCGEFYASPTYKGELRLTFVSKCTVRAPLVADELCKFVSTKLKVKNLGKKSTKVKVRSWQLTSSEADANSGPTMKKKVKTKKKAKTFKLIKHKAGKAYCYVGKCSSQFGELYHFEVVNRGITVGGVWWNSNVPPWPGLTVPLWD